MYSLDRCASKICSSSNLLFECGHAKSLHHSLGWLRLDLHFLSSRDEKAPVVFSAVMRPLQKWPKIFMGKLGGYFHPYYKWSFFTQLINSPLLSPAPNCHFPYLFTELWTLPNIILLPPLVAWRHQEETERFEYLKWRNPLPKNRRFLGMGTPLHIGLTYCLRRWVLLFQVTEMLWWRIIIYIFSRGCL